MYPPPPPYYGAPPPAAFYAPPPMMAPPRRYSPWLVPLIFLVNLGMFIWIMYENNCPSRMSKDQCMGGHFLDRFSFQPWRDNRMIGPTPETLQRLGGLDNKLVLNGEAWRLFSAMWLHAGLIHLFVNMLSLDFVGLRLEQDFGFHRFGFVYVLAGLGGSLGSCLNIIKQQRTSKTISVGASGAIFGLLGASLSELITNWTVYDDKCSTIMILILNAALNLLIGFLLHMDNSAHVGGLVAGFFLGFVFFVKPQLGYVSSKYMPTHNQVKRTARHNFCQYFLGVVGLVVSIILFATAFGKLFNIKEIRQHLPDGVNKY
ncbi:rhomboid-like protease 2 [Pyrus ussuriensis x Pyrus communis]|uniref:RHOMBOID-like protein n=1 Tax=Pyrus ussuriensis x Pyrus communis TaxID=2448454 RepID=A0A5N5G7M4_9ROSA|nr:rhomboid-like protease 2 [Pyrus ussuriensis x Pyrus communis]